jgi:hypothetical protein
LKPTVPFSNILFNFASDFVFVIFFIFYFAKDLKGSVRLVDVLCIFVLCLIIILNYFVALFVEIFLSKVRQMATVDRIEGLIGLFLVVHAKARFFLDDCLFGTN